VRRARATLRHDESRTIGGRSAILAMRRSLAQRQLFHGAHAIAWELAEAGIASSPSVRTVSRVLERHGLISRARGPSVATIWSRLVPEHQQIDNEMVFYGSRAHPRGMGPLIRLCLTQQPGASSRCGVDGRLQASSP
jgi:hypothetical protein